jgi:hypothetical protein
MRMCRPWFFALSALFLLPFSVAASDHSSDMSGAFSYDQGSTLLGAYFSLGITPLRNATTLERLSIIGDVGVHRGTTDGGDPVSRTAFAIGGRFWATPDPWRNRLYGQATFGGVRDHIGSAVATNVTGAVGMGYEFHFRPVPPTPGALNTGGLAARVQVDRLFVNDVDDHTRISVGLVWRIP